MPRGSESFIKSTERQKARSDRGRNFPRYDEFKILSGERARVRFLEQGEDITWAFSHRIIPPWSKFPNDIICLDQKDEGTPCPACSSDDINIRKRQQKGYLNVIWRGNDDLAELNEKIKDTDGLKGPPYKLAPVYKLSEKGYPEKDSAGNKVITGFEDRIFLWKCSKTVFMELLSKDSSYKGLMSRDFQILREGASKDDTKYFVEPAVIDGGPEPMIVADMALMTSKLDLDAITTPPSFEEMVQILSGKQEEVASVPGYANGGNLPDPNEVFQGQPPMRSSAFSK
jgi:hypothetical protein